MKHLLLSVVAGFAAMCAFAQPTLTNANFVPTIGETYTYYVADSLMAPGGNGANVTWDFSSLKGYALPTEVTYIVNPAQTPLGPTYFSTSQFADTTAEKNKTYYTANATNMNNKGYIFYNSLTGNAVINLNANDEKLMEFPFTYSNTFTDNFSGTANYTFMGVPMSDPITGSITVVADGHGTLMLPFGQNFSNVLRVVSTESSNVNTQFGPVAIESTVYSFYEPQISKYPLLRIVNSSFNGTQTNMAHCMYPLNPGASVKEYLAVKDLRVFPNPSASGMAQVYFTATEAEQVVISVKNMLGQDIQVLFNGTSQVGPNTLPIDASMFSNGIYIITIQSQGKQESIKWVLE